MTTYREMRASERDQAKALLALARSSEGVTVKRVPAGFAAGLARDIGTEGKGRRRRTMTLYGDGKRRGDIIAECWSKYEHGTEILVRA